MEHSVLKLMTWALPMLLAIPCGLASAASLPSATAVVSSFDGSYSGTTSLVAGSQSGCEPGRQVRVTVLDGRFHYAWRPDQDAQIQIGRDGRYSAMLRGSFVAADKYLSVLPRIDGHADGRVLTGEYGTRWCKYTYRFERS